MTSCSALAKTINLQPYFIHLLPHQVRCKGMFTGQSHAKFRNKRFPKSVDEKKRKVGQLAADLGELAGRVYIKLSHIRRPCRRVDAATPP